nr:MAG TPA: hypothetical protein [Caudoviricetes sp.]
MRCYGCQRTINRRTNGRGLLPRQTIRGRYGAYLFKANRGVCNGI